MPVEVVDDVGRRDKLVINCCPGLAVEKCLVHNGECLLNSRQIVSKTDIPHHIGSIRHSCNILTVLYLVGIGILHCRKYKRQFVHLWYVVAECGISALVTNGDNDVQLSLCVLLFHYLSCLHNLLLWIPMFAVDIPKGYIGIYALFPQMLKDNTRIINKVITLFSLREHHKYMLVSYFWRGIPYSHGNGCHHYHDTQ